MHFSIFFCYIIKIDHYYLYLLHTFRFSIFSSFSFHPYILLCFFCNQVFAFFWYSYYLKLFFWLLFSLICHSYHFLIFVVIFLILYFHSELYHIFLLYHQHCNYHVLKCWFRFQFYLHFTCILVVLKLNFTFYDRLISTLTFCLFFITIVYNKYIFAINRVSN